MSTFRYSYSEDGIDRILRRGLRQTFAISALVLLAVFGTVASDLAPNETWALPPIFAATLVFTFWRQRQSTEGVRNTIKLTVIELNDEELIGGNPSATRSIRRGVVVALRQCRDGILVRGRNLKTIRVDAGLDQFEDLARKLGTWAPPEAARVQSPGSIHQSVIALTVLNFILMGTAFFIQNPVVAIACCAGEIILLAFSLYWILRRFVQQNLKRRLISLVMFVTALLLYRVYSLWQHL